MSNLLGYFVLIASSCGAVIISICEPRLLSDENLFLKEFVDSDLLNILGVIVAITAASAANVHLELRKLEDKYKARDAFYSTRAEVRRGAFALVYLFAAATALAILKPVLAYNPILAALFNSSAIVILIWNLLVLIGLLELSFKIGPINIEGDEDR